MLDLKTNYARENFLLFLKDFLPDDHLVHEKAQDLPLDHAKSISNAVVLSECKSLGMKIFEVEHSGSKEARVGLAREAFRIMADTLTNRALVVFKSSGGQWRLSLMTIQLDYDESKNKIKKAFSNTRRYSYMLGQEAKVNTPHKFLIDQGKIKSLEDLEKRFSVEVVNNEFYKEIAKLYDELVGTEKIIRKLVYPNDGDESHEFAVRLIGRIIFCWFLREKKSKASISLVPSGILSREASDESNYYHNVLAPLFFEVLNKPIPNRTDKFKTGMYANIPYLNGGLFNDDNIDYYKFDKDLKSSVPGLVDVPDGWLHDLFDLLERFNFTVDENTSYDTDLSIDPEMLGRVFENLLARINPETGETVRKSTGSFYTPREIVGYMVDSSLSEYLGQKTGIDRKKIDALISYDLFDDLENELNEQEGVSVLEALSTLTVLDPACGSGAFPIGMLQKIVFIITKLDPKADWWLAKQLEGASPELRREFANRSVDYIRKLGIIRQTIFGVDIQPIATEISRLRCFLTLIVDEAVDDTQENRGIRPLPNLDFKFVTANSLIPLPKPRDRNGEISEVQGAMFEETSHIDELKQIRHEYFSSTSHERIELQSQFNRLQKNMVLTNVDVFRGSGSKLYDTLSRWEPFEHKPSDWFDPAWMFGITDGFGVVIGNPPYIRHRDLPKDLKVTLKEIYSTGNTTSDIYCYFYELAYLLLQDRGLATYITSNKWLRAKYGQNIRKLFKLNTKILEIIDLGSNQFSAATVDTNIILFQKSRPNDEHSLRYASRLPDVAAQILTMKQCSLSLDGFSITDIASLELLEKIEAEGIQLKDFPNLKINYGVLTGKNEVKTPEGKQGVFIIDTKTRNELIEDDASAADLIRPILRGRDIKRYCYDWSDKYLIAMHYGSHALIDNYPSIKAHLSKYEDILRSRAQVRRGDHHWIELDQNPSKNFMDEFSQGKIIFPIISSKPSYAYDNNGYFHNDKAFHVIGDNLEYVLGFLNSNLANWAIQHYGPTLGNGGFEYRKIFVEKLPLVKSSDLNENTITGIIELVKKIIEQKSNNHERDTHDLEMKIDQLVYKLYKLTPEEIEIIEDHG